GRLKALGQMRLNGGLLVDLSELGAEYSDRPGELEPVGPHARIVVVGRGAMAIAKLEGAALLGFGAHRLGEHHVGGCGGETGGHCKLDKIAARDLALAGKPGGDSEFMVEFRHC